MKWSHPDSDHICFLLYCSKVKQLGARAFASFSRFQFFAFFYALANNFLLPRPMASKPSVRLHPLISHLHWKFQVFISTISKAMMIQSIFLDLWKNVLSFVFWPDFQTALAATPIDLGGWNLRTTHFSCRSTTFKNNFFFYPLTQLHQDDLPVWPRKNP